MKDEAKTKKQLIEELLSLRASLSDYRQLEEEFRLKNIIFSAQQEVNIEGVLVLDNHGEVLSYNKKFIEMWGVPRETSELKSGEHIMHFVAGKVADKTAWLDRVDSLNKDGASISREEISLTDGRTLDCYSAPVQGPDGASIGRSWYFHDITDHRMVQESLRQFMLAVEESPISVVITDLQGNITFVNSRFTEVSGYNFADVIGRNPRMFKSGYTSPELYARLWETISSGRVWRGELFNRKKDGNCVWERTSISSMVDENGEKKHYIAFKEDITEHKRAEEELKKTLSLIQATLESTTDGILVADSAGRFTGYNKQFVRLWNLSRDILARNDNDLVLDRILKQLKDPDAFIAKVRELHVHPEETSFDVLELSDGRIYERYSQPQMLEKKPMGRVWSFRDISERRQAEDQLKESQRRLFEIIEFLPDATFVIDKEGKVIAWNRAMEVMTGVKAEDILGKGDYEYTIPFYGTRRPMLIDLALHPDSETEKHYSELQKTGDILFGESYTPNLPGGITHLAATASTLRDSKGDIIAVIECIRDNTDRKRAEEALLAAETLYRTLAERSFAGVYVVQDSKFRYINSNAASFAGYTKDELQDREADQLVYPEDRESAKLNARAMLQGERNSPYEFRITSKKGEIRWIMETVTSILYQGRPAILGNSMDMTEHKKMEEQILALSITDQLTGLFNRRGFLTLAEKQLKVAERSQTSILLLFADLDGLKSINDTLGHQKGDEALTEAAEILKGVFRESDIIARTGGDEFVVLACGVSRADSDILKVRLQQQIDAHNARQKKEYKISMSIGIVYKDPETPGSIDELISQADALMYEQKKRKYAYKS